MGKISHSRLFDQPEDFKKLGINPNEVELWEEGRRSIGENPGTSEIWYFDGTAEDGTKYMVGFRPKTLEGMMATVDSPNCSLYIKSPEGKEYRDMQVFEAEGNTTSKEKCDCKYGPNTCTGDFRTYDIHYEPVHGVGLDLHYEALTEPFRQGTGIVVFGDNDEFHHTDLAVPKNKVTGTIYYDGEEHPIECFGYHDHQWMNTVHTTLYHHWFWGRMYTDKYTVYIYDFVAAKKYGYKQLPMFGLLDNETGKVVFMTDGHFDLETELEPEVHAGREFPKRSHYIFRNEDGCTVDLDVTWEDQLEFTDYYAAADEAGKKRFDMMDLNIQYTRYYAKGTVRYTDAQTEEVTEAKGDMIYEYAYMQNPDPAAHV